MRTLYYFKRLCWGLLLAVAANAQQTVFDVPSADVAKKHDFFYQHQTVARTWSPGATWLQTNALGIGLGHGLEFDLTQFNLDPRAPKSSVLAVGLKAVAPLNHEEHPLELVIGGQIQFGFSQTHYGDWGYAMLSQTLGSHETRVTGGITTGSRLLFGEKTTGAMVAIEQPLSSKWMFQADWFSGKHDLSYVIPGVVYRLNPHWMVSLGYQLPNAKTKGYEAVVFELTRI